MKLAKQLKDINAKICNLTERGLPPKGWRKHSNSDYEKAEVGEHGIAIDCEASGLVVIDLDIGQWFDGVAEFYKAFPGLPDTYTTQTKSGGRHLYFRGRVETRMGLMKGVDVRSVGALVKAYETTLSNVPITELPEQVMNMLQAIDNRHRQDLTPTGLDTDRA